MVCLHWAYVYESPFMYRLNHSILDPPMAVLLHPGLLDDHSSSVPGRLSVDRKWDQFQKKQESSTV